MYKQLNRRNEEEETEPGIPQQGREYKQRDPVETEKIKKSEISPSGVSQFDI